MQKGIITTYVLVFGAIFLLLLSGLLGFILLQLRQASQKAAWTESLQVAEAGVNYYRWCLNNDIESNCLVEKEYFDTAEEPVGHFSLQIDPSIYCGTTTQRQVISTGWTKKFPSLKRKIQVSYSKESVAKYAYLLNDNVWAGADREIRGLYHSNGGIRMDGENYSLVTSATPNGEWVCTQSFGCPPCPSDCRTDENGDCLCPGVFTTANGDKDLFKYPVPPFDFDEITVDLAKMKDTAQGQGFYFPPSTDINPEGKGYHLKFRNDGSFKIWIITRLDPVLAYNIEEGWHYDYFIIDQEYLYNTYSIDSTCPVIFIEDNLWLEGEVKGRVSIASANLINPNKDTDVILPANIDYATLDGSDGLTVFGERDVLIGPDSPSVMTLRGIFIAQKGHFGRNHYTGQAPTKRGQALTIYGSIVSNGRVGTAWLNPAGQVVSGYLKRENYVDPNLLYDPPPFTHFVTTQNKIINWEEIE